MIPTRSLYITLIITLPHGVLGYCGPHIRHTRFPLINMISSIPYYITLTLSGTNYIWLNCGHLRKIAQY